MALIYTIEVTSTCTGWSEVCSTAERLARDAAELAAVRGMAASGVACPAPVELGITLASAVEQQRLNRDYREQDVPTNVLAFPAWEPGTHIPPGAPLLLGDVLCSPLRPSCVRHASSTSRSPTIFVTWSCTVYFIFSASIT